VCVCVCVQNHTLQPLAMRLFGWLGVREVGLGGGEGWTRVSVGLPVVLVRRVHAVVVELPPLLRALPAPLVLLCGIRRGEIRQISHSRGAGEEGRGG